MPTTQEKKKPAVKSHPWMFPLMCGLVVGIIGVGYWRQITVQPQLTIPNPVLPNPNAYDYFIHAEGMLKKVQNTVPSAKIDIERSIDSYKPQERDALLVQYQPALQKAQEGLKHSYYQPPIRDWTEMGAQRREACLNLPYLLELQAASKRDSGKMDEALSALLDAVQLAIAMQRGAMMYDAFLATRSAKRALNSLIALRQRLTAKQAHRVSRKLHEIASNAPTLGDIANEERWGMTARLMKDAKQPLRLNRNFEKVFVPDSLGGLNRATATFEMYTTSAKNIVEDYDICMSGLSESINFGIPLAGGNRRLPTTRYLLSLIRFPFREIGEAKRELHKAIVEFGLAAYHKEKQTYPDSLEMLVPQYLPGIPNDPLSPGQRFGYQRKGDAFEILNVSYIGQMTPPRKILPKN